MNERWLQNANGYFAPHPVSGTITPMPDPQTILAQLERIEDEMKCLGLWQQHPLEPGQYDFHAAFAADTMSFAQWLQFIFIPNVKGASANGKFPSESHVAAQAIREFDGIDEASALISLLADFDSLF
jgi:uncharacterized protein YqcC (DUF446 family)